MNKIILSILVIIASGCATSKKCGGNQENENAVYNQQTCEPYLRSGFYLDQISPAVAEKLKQGGSVKLNWISTKATDQVVIPAHVEVEIKEGQ